MIGAAGNRRIEDHVIGWGGPRMSGSGGVGNVYRDYDHRSRVTGRGFGLGYGTRTRWYGCRAGRGEENGVDDVNHAVCSLDVALDNFGVVDFGTVRRFGNGDCATLRSDDDCAIGEVAGEHFTGHKMI